MKVIFIAFANSQTSPLPGLAAEDDALMKTLSFRYLAGDYLVHRESFATTDSVLRYLDLYKNDLAIFHFSGHANSVGLAAVGGNLFANGLAEQLRYSAEHGNLKLVVLNGCSTYGQMKLFKDAGVPVIISTNAPVDDEAAKRFSTKLWEELVGGVTISNAFESGLRNARTVSQSVPAGANRHLFTDDDVALNSDAPLWRLDYASEADIEKNPTPRRPNGGALPPPNETLTATLYKAFNDAGNAETIALQNRNPTAEDSARQIAIVNSIPYPVGTHLQKLICPTDPAISGYDTFGKKRLDQITQVFQTTMEFLGIIMISQLWEVHLKSPNGLIITDLVKTKLKEYINFRADEGEVYNFKSLIDTLGAYLYDCKSSDVTLEAMINNLDVLNDLRFGGDEFDQAYNYLLHMRSRVLKDSIEESLIINICAEAEIQLGVFLSKVSFIHNYHLSSVQRIDILKLRHIKIPDTEFKHSIITCMQAIGKNSQNFYYIRSFLDNWGVALLKSNNTPKNTARKFSSVVTEYLNLSPFIIDRNAFDEKADIAFITFYKCSDADSIIFKSVARPLSDETFEVQAQESQDDRFDSIRTQFDAFKKFIQ